MSKEADPNKFYTWVVEISVNAVWVADGFDLKDGDEVAELLLVGRLSHCRSDEVLGRVISAPDKDAIAHEQGEFVPRLVAKGLTKPQRAVLLARVNDRMKRVNMRVVSALCMDGLLDSDGDPTSYGRAVAKVLA